MFREIDEIRMVEYTNCCGLVMCSLGMFTFFSLLIMKILHNKKKLCFRDRILVKSLDYSCDFYNSGRIMATHSLFSSLPFTLLPFLLYLKKLFTEPYFAPGTILVLPVLQDIDPLIILTTDEDIGV